MKTTTVTKTKADGTTVTEKNSSCCLSSGCAWFFAIGLFGYALVGPTSLPLWGEILTYAGEAVLVVVAVAYVIQRERKENA